MTSVSSVVEPLLLSKHLLRTGQHRYIRETCIVHAYEISKSLSLQLLTNPCASIHFSHTHVCQNTKLGFRERGSCSFAERNYRSLLHREGPRHRSISFHKHKRLFTTLTAFFYRSPCLLLCFIKYPLQNLFVTK